MSRPDPQPLQLLDSPVRRRLVDLLANQPDTSAGGLTAAELGDALDLHSTTARFHLDQLEDAGLVESHLQRGKVGRPRKVYRLPTRPLPERSSEGAFRVLTNLLTSAWADTADGERPTPEEAGLRWARTHAVDPDRPAPRQARSPGAWLGKVGETVDLLRQFGYQPEVRTEDGGRTAELTLVDCPFLELAHAHPDVVCGVHRGLLRGTLEAVGEPDTEVGLRPLVEPRVCLARITTRADLASGRDPD